MGGKDSNACLAEGVLDAGVQGAQSGNAFIWVQQEGVQLILDREVREGCLDYEGFRILFQPRSAIGCHRAPCEGGMASS